MAGVYLSVDRLAYLFSLCFSQQNEGPVKSRNVPLRRIEVTESIIPQASFPHGPQNTSDHRRVFERWSLVLKSSLTQCPTPLSSVLPSIQRNSLSLLACSSFGTSFRFSSKTDRLTSSPMISYRCMIGSMSKSIYSM